MIERIVFYSVLMGVAACTAWSLYDLIALWR
jgi:hypothetical protein